MSNPSEANTIFARFLDAFSDETCFFLSIPRRLETVLL